MQIPDTLAGASSHFESPINSPLSQHSGQFLIALPLVKWANHFWEWMIIVWLLSRQSTFSLQVIYSVPVTLPTCSFYLSSKNCFSICSIYEILCQFCELFPFVWIPIRESKDDLGNQILLHLHFNYHLFQKVECYFGGLCA